MSYSTAQMNSAVDALVKAIPGLQPDVARAWVLAEQGVNYNILGVTYTDSSGQHLFKYSSWSQGAAAANKLIQTGPYAGIRNALKTGNSQKEAAAIIASPWNHPYYSKGAGASALRQVAGTASASNPPTPISSGTSTNPTPSGSTTSPIPNAQSASFNPLDVGGAITNLGVDLQKLGVWFGIFILGAFILGAGIFVLVKKPAEEAVKTVAPIAAVAA